MSQRLDVYDAKEIGDLTYRMKTQVFQHSLKSMRVPLTMIGLSQTRLDLELMMMVQIL